VFGRLVAHGVETGVTPEGFVIAQVVWIKSMGLA
jgi:hypothetical protein